MVGTTTAGEIAAKMNLNNHNIIIILFILSTKICEFTANH